MPDYLTEEDEPISGREDGYGLVMEYRVDLATMLEHDFERATGLQELLVAWTRQQAEEALALPKNAPLDRHNRNRIRSLGVSLESLGSILREQGNGDCKKYYEEAIQQYRRAKDAHAEAIVHLNLGHGYKNIAEIRDLDSAEIAYRRSLELRNRNAAHGRAGTILQIGQVHHLRLREAKRRKEPKQLLLRMARSAEEHYLQALKLCPPSAVEVLGPLHNQLGCLYDDVGDTERAREHHEKTVQIYEQTGDRYRAGQSRYNIALMYRQAASTNVNSSQQRDSFLRAKAYAHAALRDYKHYAGRAAAQEAKAQRLLDDIKEDLAKLPQ